MLSPQHLIINFILEMIGQAERTSMKYGMHVERCIMDVLPLSLIVTLNSTSPRRRDTAVPKRSRVELRQEQRVQV